LHVERTQEAADNAEEALAIVDQTPHLREYHVLALDRAALYALAAGRFERALAHYDGVLEFTEVSPTSQRNRVATRLGHAAAALGARQPEKTLADLTVVQTVLDSPGAATALALPHAKANDVIRNYRLISTGLQVNALRQLGRGAEATRALERRRELLMEQFKQSDRDEDLRELTLVEIQLADNAVERADRAATVHWAAAALDHASALGQRTQTRLPQEELDGLWLAAELDAFQGIRISGDLPVRLKNALFELARHPDRTGRSEARWLEICLALMML